MRYWTKALASILRNGLLGPRRTQLEFVKRWLSYGLRCDSRPQAPSVLFRDIYPDAQSIILTMEDVQYTFSNVNPYELYCLICVAKLRATSEIFEIGTFDGATTWQLARHSPESKVYTIDLASSDMEELRSDMVASEIDNVCANKVGVRYQHTPEQTRIVQLYGDSTRYNYSEYFGKMDYVFVDACHEYKYVAADSATALRLIRRGGVILWHDYQRGWPGVVKAVDELLNEHPVMHIAGTTLAILDTTLRTVGNG